jgi:hypothetical protein
MRLTTRLFAALIVALVGSGACVTTPATRGPDAGAPTRILLGWSGDAATSRAVTWRTLGAQRSESTIVTRRTPHPATSRRGERVQFRDRNFPHKHDQLVRKICIPFRVPMGS